MSTEIQKEVFNAVNENVHSMVCLVDREVDDSYHQRYLCVTGTNNDFPTNYKIHTVVKSENGLKSKQDWPLSGLKSINYISRDSCDFELEWDKLYHWTAGTVKEKEIFFDVLHRICSPQSSPPTFLNYPEIDVEFNGIQSFDEPLDMSLKSRKRSHGNESNSKKKRSSSYAVEHTSRPTRHSDQLPRTSHILNDLLTKNRDLETQEHTTEDIPSRIIISNDVDGGLEEHFRRSLCKEFYTNVDSEGVDEHFSRSLGSAKWKEIQRSANLKLNHEEGQFSNPSKITSKSTLTKSKPKT